MTFPMLSLGWCWHAVTTIAVCSVALCLPDHKGHNTNSNTPTEALKTVCLCRQQQHHHNKQQQTDTFILPRSNFKLNPFRKLFGSVHKKLKKKINFRLTTKNDKRTENKKLKNEICCFAIASIPFLSWRIVIGRRPRFYYVGSSSSPNRYPFDDEDDDNTNEPTPHRSQFSFFIPVSKQQCSPTFGFHLAISHIQRQREE